MRTLLVALLLASVIVASQESGNSLAGATKHPLLMSIAPSDSLTAGRQITQLTVTFTNISARVVTFTPGATEFCGTRPSKTSWVKLNLTGPNGKLYRMDYKGDGPPFSGSCAGKIEPFIVNLRPHESIAIPLDTGKYVDLTDAKQYEHSRFPSGFYSVQAEFNSVWYSPQQDKKTTWEGTLKSNTLQIQFDSEFAATYIDPR
jgi:hypothetical protein